jgi:hypothetical protein
MRPGRSRASQLHHPWRRFAQLREWSLRWAELPPGVMGSTCHTTRTVTLALGMSQAERRCTIAHETEHILRGPVGAHLAAREELAVDRRVAALLVPDLGELAAATARAQGRLEVAADELWVDEYILHVRIAALSDRERAFVESRLPEVFA